MKRIKTVVMASAFLLAFVGAITTNAKATNKFVACYKPITTPCDATGCFTNGTGAFCGFQQIDVNCTSPLVECYLPN